MATRRARNRWSAAVVLALAALSQLAAMAHEAWVPHVVCAEHGERVHELGAEPPAASTVAAAAIGSATHRLEPRAPTRAHQHDHCGVVVCRRAAALAATPDAPCTLASAEQPLLPQGRLPFARTVLAHAPKTSPPATRCFANTLSTA